MDGNGRWATRRFLPRVAGHKQGVDVAARVRAACGERGRPACSTVFAFSSENWNRPAEEVSGLMELLVVALAREVPQLQAEGVRAAFRRRPRRRCPTRCGPAWPRPRPPRPRNTRLVFNVCFNYGGRWDIAQAAAQAGRARRSHHRNTAWTAPWRWRTCPIPTW